MIKLKQFVDGKVCLKCQGCCRFLEDTTIWAPCLLDEEIKVFKKDTLNPSMISPEKKLRLLPSAKGDIFFCPFFNVGKNKCKIYTRRPFECQLYPFVINRREGEIFLAVDLNCPLVKDKLNSKPFRKYVSYLTGLLKSRKYRDILKNNPQIIQGYKKVSDLAEINL